MKSVLLVLAMLGVQALKLSDAPSSVDKAAVQKFVELSDMFPSQKGQCKGEQQSIKEIDFCSDLIKEEDMANSCLVYNFGVGEQDPFLEGMLAEYQHCQIFAFDPFVSQKDIPVRLQKAKQVVFNTWGLWNGQAERSLDQTSRDGTAYTGKFMTLHEIQKELGHLGKPITLFRSDCEGCEWGWVSQAMKDDPTVFERIGQMFIEVHVVHVIGMSNMKQAWVEGLPENASESVGAVHSMIKNNFRVLLGRVNPGLPSDRDRVPESLQKAGVPSFPCCREYSLINRKFAQLAPAQPNPEESNFNSTQFESKFMGQQGKCATGRSAQVGDIKYCPDMLARRARDRTCLIYMFGGTSPSERSFLARLGQDHGNCSVLVLDPRLRKGSSLTDLHRHAKVFDWGLYQGKGPRVTWDGDTRMEHYTVREIFNSWAGKDVEEAPGAIHTAPTKIALLYMNPAAVPRDFMARALNETWGNWWGQYPGLDAIEQMA